MKDEKANQNMIEYNIKMQKMEQDRQARRKKELINAQHYNRQVAMSKCQQKIFDGAKDMLIEHHGLNQKVFEVR